jgi:hypothetical protein
MENQSTIYNSDHLNMLSRVLEETMAAMLQFNGRSRSDAQIQELSSRLGKIIMDRFAAGETDPERLKEVALESIQRR